VLISAAAAEDSPTKRLYDWLLSEEGQKLIAAEGYVSVMDFETLPRETEIEIVGKPWEGEWNSLAPLAEPERVTAYAGQRLSDRWPGRNGCLYGLMTREGEAVTPPVFSSVERLTWQDWFSDESLELRPLVLRQGSGERGEWGALQSAYTLAAGDLSWAYPGTWRQVIPGPGYLLLLGEDHMDQVSEEGELLKRWDYAAWGLTEYMPELLSADFFDSIQGHVAGNLLGLGAVDWSANDTEFNLFDLDSGEIVTHTWSELEKMFPFQARESDIWNVTETETGCRLTRGEESLELPIPALTKYGQLWGDLVVFLWGSRVFYRDGREVLPSAEEGTWRAGSPMAGGELLTLSLNRKNNTSTTWFLHPDGSFLGVTAERDQLSGELFNITLDGYILGIVERDRASYYRIDTEVCIFRVPLYYEGD
jgi:hypothetical protein